MDGVASRRLHLADSNYHQRLYQPPPPLGLLPPAYLASLTLPVHPIPSVTHLPSPYCFSFYSTLLTALGCSVTARTGAQMMHYQQVQASSK